MTSLFSRRHLFRAAAVIAVPVAPIALADPALAAIEKLKAAEKAEEAAEVVFYAAAKHVPQVDRYVIRCVSVSDGHCELRTSADVSRYIAKRRAAVASGEFGMGTLQERLALVDGLEQRLHAEMDKIEAANAARKRVDYDRLEKECVAAGDIRYELLADAVNTMPETLAGMRALIEMVASLSALDSLDPRVEEGLATLVKAAAVLMPQSLNA